MARLVLQMHDLLQCTRFTSDMRSKITDASFAVSERLVNCWKIQDKLVAACDNAERELPPSPGPHLLHLPHVIELQRDSETFLYEAKNFLRDLICIINIAFGTSFSEANQLFIRKKDSILVWAERTFHPDDPINVRLRLHKDWIKEMVFKRNAVEHPGGRRSGPSTSKTMPMIDGSLRRPVWYQDQDTPKNIENDMRLLCDNMLLFAEELIVIIAQRAMIGTPFCIREIPEQRRDRHVPMRFVVHLTEEEAGLLAEAQAQRQIKENGFWPFWFIAAGCEEAGRVLRGIGVDGVANCVPESMHHSCRGVIEERLDLGRGFLDRVEVGTVGRQEEA